MQELLLVNPRKRAGRKTRKASPAQRAARAKFAAMARARRKNPAKRRAHATKRSHAVTVRRRRNPIVARRRSIRRRNPISMSGFVGTATGMLKDAVIGGAGALAVDVVAGYGKPYLPASLQSGMAYTATKALATVALGMIGRKVLGSTALAAARGALTVQAYGVMKPYVPASMTLGSLSPTALMPGGYSGKPVALSRGNPVRLNALTPASGAMGLVNAMVNRNNTQQYRPR